MLLTIFYWGFLGLALIHAVKAALLHVSPLLMQRDEATPAALLGLLCAAIAIALRMPA